MSSRRSSPFEEEDRSSRSGSRSSDYGGSPSTTRSEEDGLGDVWDPGSFVSEFASESPSALYAALLRAQPQRCFLNFVISPFSVWRVFRALELGAGGRTLAEMRRYFHEEREEIHPPDLEPSAFFHLAERVYVGSNGKDQQLATYRDHLRELGADVQLLSFRSGGDAASKINGYVHAHTDGLAGDIISEGELPGEPHVIAVSAAILRAQWENSFTEVLQGTFYAMLSAQQHAEQQVIFIQQRFDSELVEYTSLADVKIVRLPFSDRRLGMYIILPSDYGKFVRSLENLPSLLDQHIVAAMFKDQAERPEKREVLVKLPRFRVSPEECKVSILPAMAQLGITHLSEGADFSRMSDRGHTLTLDVWNHETGIAVDENGMLAFTASAEGARTIPGFHERPLEFIADRPFIFSVVFQPDFEDPENVGTSDLVLLNGHVVDALAAQRG